jgi:hypothetical protein
LSMAGESFPPRILKPCPWHAVNADVRIRARVFMSMSIKGVNDFSVLAGYVDCI